MTNEYRSRITTPEKALSVVKSGQRVYVHNGCAEPEILVSALVQRASELHDVQILHMATFGRADYTAPRYAGHFRLQSLFLGANVRQAVQEGRADYTPIFLSEIEDLAPRTFCDSFVHVSRIHAFPEASHPLVEYKSHQMTDVHRAIARRVANLIPDGAVLQTGIGGLPEAMLELLGDHKDLGIHSEMVPDGVVNLIEAGVINNARKSLHRGKAVAGFALGSRRLFDFIDDNPIFEFRRTSYVNDPCVIAQNERMVAINSAIEVDLTGQVCSDSMGCLPFSGIGGQVDFIRGAARSKGGLPIIALPSTAKNGAISRIVPVLEEGAGVVTRRGDIHYVVTEYGAADLWGKNIRQRTEALIGIAHPDFRGDLLSSAKARKYVFAG